MIEQIKALKNREAELLQEHRNFREAVRLFEQLQAQAAKINQALGDARRRVGVADMKISKIEQEIAQLYDESEAQNQAESAPAETYPLDRVSLAQVEKDSETQAEALLASSDDVLEDFTVESDEPIDTEE